MMKRFIAYTLMMLTLIFVGAAHAEAEKFEEELHYFSVIPEQPGGEGERVQVVEFFWYACPHCYDLEPHLKSWLKKKPDYVDYVAIPAMFNRENVIMHAKTYYALNLMGLVDPLHEKLFDAVHRDRIRLNTPDEMEAFLEKEGVDIEAYRKAMKSFAVQTQARRAAVLADRFDIRGVPAIVVDGKYRTGGMDGPTMMEVTDFLIDKVRKEKGYAN
ncbi:MAG: thiol:disulfide interchange protein DsbA/DsbL [Chromatiales bacterium]|nr:thiol:disulfide interchange protein DsbA/DsbL [Chromatiales bacterium]